MAQLNGHVTRIHVSFGEDSMIRSTILASFAADCAEGYPGHAVIDGELLGALRANAQLDMFRPGRWMPLDLFWSRIWNNSVLGLGIGMVRY